MKTVIINQDNQVVRGPFSKPYVELFPKATINEGLREVPYVNTPKPVIDSAIEKAIDTGYHYDSETDSYRQVWEKQPLSDYELAAKDWLHIHRKKRIIAPISLAEQYPGIETHFRLNELEIEVLKDQGVVHLYCDTIKPDHQPLIDANPNVLEEDIPAILLQNET